MKRIVKFALLLGALFVPLWACVEAAQMDLAPALKTLAEKYQLPGVVGAILHGNDLVAIGSTGVRKSGDPTPLLPGDIIHLGSDTKAMTAILIGRLVDQKKITFNSTMRELFPDFAAGMNPDTARVTVRNLLTHTGGFPHDLNWWALNATRLPLPQQRRRAVANALSAAPTKLIGTYNYSNVGFVLLGAIVEARTGKSWEEVIQQEIFQPLRMITAGFGPPSTKGSMTQPWGHVLQDGKLVAVQNDNAAVMGPAGTVHCSIADWSKFIAEILHSAQGHPTLVSLETFNELIRPMPGQDYAGGWLVTRRPWAGGRAMNHNGSNTTWYCDVWIAPDRDFAVMLATNYGAKNAAEAADKGVLTLIDVNSNLPKVH
jgi:CubicO group peptidase (beta-lactamase class C family)